MNTSPITLFVVKIVYDHTTQKSDYFANMSNMFHPFFLGNSCSFLRPFHLHNSKTAQLTSLTNSNKTFKEKYKTKI